MQSVLLLVLLLVAGTAYAAVPPVVATGELCTYNATQFHTLNTTCFPVSYNDTATYNYCRARRSSTDVPCVIAACTAYVAFRNRRTATDTVPYRTFLVLRARFELYNDNEFDTTANRIAQVVSKFMIDNQPSSYSPITPAPRSLGTATPLYSVATYAAGTSMQTTPREFARQFIAFYWNYIGNTRPELAPTSREAIARYSVVTPTRCPSAEVTALPWLQGNNVTVSALFNLAFQLMIFNSPTATVTNATWPAYCNLRIASTPSFCAAFASGYYGNNSMFDFDMLPSPYRDVNSVITAYNEEYPNCGAARGCFGYT